MVRSFELKLNRPATGVVEFNYSTGGLESNLEATEYGIIFIRFNQKKEYIYIFLFHLREKEESEQKKKCTNLNLCVWGNSCR